MNGGLHEDRVIVRITSRGEVEKEEGEVIKILERANKTIVGTYESSKNFGFVIPDDSRIAYDIFIPKAHVNGLKQIKSIGRDNNLAGKEKKPEGKIVEVLGFVGEKGVDILSIMKQFKLLEEFPPKLRSKQNSGAGCKRKLRKE